MREKKRRRVDPDKFGRSRTFGYPIDISGLENSPAYMRDSHAPLGPNGTFLNSLMNAIFKVCVDNGNPRTELIAKEEEAENERLHTLTTAWLHEAMRRLPKNQELCIYLRFRFDNSKEYKTLRKIKEPVLKEFRTTQEIADILGISQATVYRNIKSGIKNLHKDFELYLKPALNKRD